MYGTGIASILALLVIGIIISSASAEQFSYGPGPHFQYANPKATLNPQSSPSTDEVFTIILPDNNSPHIIGIFSPDNFTKLQNNIATMAVVNITPTNAPPNLNYCPVARAILEGQDGYLYLIYNKTSGKDLTDDVYPPSCYAETGPNPINGHGATPVPEFGPISAIVLGLSLASLAAITTIKRFRA